MTLNFQAFVSAGGVLLLAIDSMSGESLELCSAE